MIRLWRIRKFVKIVNKKVKKKLSSSNSKIPNKEDNHISLEECLKEFKVHSFNREYAISQTVIFAEKNGYIGVFNPSGKKPVVDIQQPGIDLIEYWIGGYLRALIAKEWKSITLLFIILGWIAGYLTGKYT